MELQRIKKKKNNNNNNDNSSKSSSSRNSNDKWLCVYSILQLQCVQYYVYIMFSCANIYCIAYNTVYLCYLNLEYDTIQLVVVFCCSVRCLVLLFRSSFVVWLYYTHYTHLVSSLSYGYNSFSTLFICTSFPFSLTLTLSLPLSLASHTSFFR